MEKQLDILNPKMFYTAEDVLEDLLKEMAMDWTPYGFKLWIQRKLAEVRDE